MKKFVGMLGLIVFLFCVFTNISAQVRKLTEQEFSEIEKKSADITKGKSYRLRKINNIYKMPEGTLIRFWDETTEYLPSGDTHTVLKWGTKEKNDSIEFMRIGPTTYSLNSNGSWRGYPTKIESVSNQQQQSNDSETTIEYFYKGRGIFNNQVADLYESKSIIKARKNGAEFVRTVIVKYWFNLNGVRFRIEVNNDNDTRQTINEWEYDPNIKIEAPIK